VDQVVERKVPAFILDDASTTDFFGSHERVAAALFEIIQKTPGTRVIGLLGPWGSGKSTILRLFEYKLAERSTTSSKSSFVFNYDAWLHQSDPPRRSFIESLIRFLADNGLTTIDRWQDQLDRLNRRADESDTTTTPTLTLAGTLVTPTLLLVPIGLQFLEKKNETFLGLCKPTLAWYLIFAPLIASAIAYLTLRGTLNPWKAQFWNKANWSKDKHGQSGTVFSILMNKATTRVKTRAIKTPDPTVIEFQDVFRQVMNEVKHPDRRFVFVIDNLDRIPDSEAITIWSTIRSFFVGASHGRGTDDGSSPLVLLPFDPSMIERMFAKDQKDPKEARKLAQSFIDKTFDLTMRVSPPVQSGWQAYFDAKLRAAINDISDDDVYIAIKLYQSSLTRIPRGVTPRILNVLTNDIAVLTMQWDREVTFASIAYYAIHRVEIEQDIASVMTDLDSEILRFDSQWKIGIAAVYYGVSPKQVMQVVILPQVQSSIESADIKGLSALLDLPGFDAVFQVAVDSYVANQSPAMSLANAAYLIKESPIPRTVRLRETERTIRQSITASQPWTLIGRSHVTGISHLLSSCPTDELQPFITAMRRSLENVQSPGFVLDGDNATAWRDCAINIVAAAKAIGSADDKIRVPGDMAFFVKVIDGISVDSDVLKQITTSTENQRDGGSWLAADALTAQFVGPHRVRLDKIALVNKSWDFLPVATAAAQFVENAAVDSPGLAVALDSLGLLHGRVDVANTELRRLGDNGNLFDKFYTAHTAKLLEVEGALIAALIISNPTFTISNNVGNSQAGHQLLSDLKTTLADREEVLPFIDSRLHDYGTFRQFVNAAKRYQSTRWLLSQIFVRRIEDGKIGLLWVQDTIDKLEDYLEFLPVGYHDKFIRKSSTYIGYWKHFESAPLENNRFTILRACLSQQGDSGDHARRIFSAAIDGMLSESWIESLQHDDAVLQTLCSLPYEQLESLQLTDDLMVGLKDCFIAALDTNEFDEKLLQKWFSILPALEKDRQEVWRKSVRDRMLSGAQTPGLLRVLSALDDRFFTETPVPNGRYDEAIRHVVFPLVEHFDAGSGWLSAHIDVVRSWIAGAPRATRRVLVDRLATLMEQENEVAKSLFKALNLRLPTKQKSSNEDVSQEGSD
jgi:hypothetical protein